MESEAQRAQAPGQATKPKPGGEPIKRTQFFRGAVHAVVAQIEVAVLVAARCPTCDGSLVDNGRAPPVLETLLGRMDYTRHRCRCTRCAVEVYPVDAALGLLLGSGSTLGVRELPGGGGVAPQLAARHSTAQPGAPHRTRRGG
jgi:hypothetical protein